MTEHDTKETERNEASIESLNRLADAMMGRVGELCQQHQGTLDGKSPAELRDIYRSWQTIAGDVDEAAEAFQHVGLKMQACQRSCRLVIGRILEALADRVVEDKATECLYDENDDLVEDPIT